MANFKVSLPKKKIQGPRGKRNFTKPERKRITDILALHGWNYSQTKKELAKDNIEISITSLKTYRKEFEGQIENLADKSIKKWDDNYDLTTASLLKRWAEAQDVVIKRILEVAPKSNNLDSLINAGQIIHTILNSDKSHGGGYDKETSLIEQINQHLIRQNEQKDKSSGNIQDVPFEPVE
jgi:hypothetical protein